LLSSPLLRVLKTRFGYPKFSTFVFCKKTGKKPNKLNSYPKQIGMLSALFAHLTAVRQRRSATGVWYLF